MPAKAPAIRPDDLLASVVREDFFEFVKAFWGELIHEPPVWNWHIPYLCRELQIAVELVFAGKPREYDIIINIPPGTTKSTVASVMLPAWVWTRMAHARFICASHTDTLVMDLSNKARHIIKSELYGRLFPHIRLMHDQDAKTYYRNVDGGDRLSCTVGGKTPTGFHAHIIIVDDPIDPMKALSDAELKAANDFMTQTLPSRKVDKELSLTILIMQRLHQNDPAGHWLGRARPGAVRHICLPAEASEFIRPPRLGEFYEDGLLDPKRLSRKTLAEFRALGEFMYSGQFRQHPVPLGGGMFKVSKLVVEERPPDKFASIVRYWDNAGTAGAGNFTVGAKLGVRYIAGLPEYWVLDIVRGQWSSNVREDIKLETARQDGKDVLVGQEQEPGSGGKESAEATVRRLAGFRVRVDKVSGDKILRADPYSVQVNAGAVHVLRRPWTRDYINEMEYFPGSTYKDQIDASSGAFALLAAPRLVLGALR